MRAVVFKVGAELAALAGGVPLGLGLAPGWAAGRGFAGLAAEWVQREGELAALAVAVVVGSAVAVVADGQGAAVSGGALGELARCVVGVALSMSNYGQACSQQCKACSLGNACNGGWQDGAGHFNKRSELMAVVQDF